MYLCLTLFALILPLATYINSVLHLVTVLSASLLQTVTIHVLLVLQPSIYSIHSLPRESITFVRTALPWLDPLLGTCVTVAGTFRQEAENDKKIASGWLEVAGRPERIDYSR